MLTTLWAFLTGGGGWIIGILGAIGALWGVVWGAKRSGRQVGEARGDAARAADRADAQAEVVDAQRRMAEARAGGPRTDDDARRRLRDGSA